MKPASIGDYFTLNGNTEKRITYRAIKVQPKTVVAERTTAEGTTKVTMSLIVWRDLFDCWHRGA